MKTTIIFLLAAMALPFNLLKAEANSINEEELTCGSITGIKIYDQITDAEVPGIGNLLNGMAISINDLPENYYLVCETSGTIESVKIWVDGSFLDIEQTPPYTYPGGAESGSNWNAGPGTYNIDANAYEFDNANNLCGSLWLTFRITGPVNCDDPNNLGEVLTPGDFCDDGDATTLIDVIGLDCSCRGTLMEDHFVTTWQTDNDGFSADDAIRIHTAGSEEYNYSIDWNNDGIFDQFNITGDVIHEYDEPGSYTIRIIGKFPRILFGSDPFANSNRKKITDVNQWGIRQWTSMEEAFRGCENLVISANDVPDLSRVTSMKLMFSGATSMNTYIGSWEVSNVIDMGSLFYNAQSFNQHLSPWNVSNVTNMAQMFEAAESFNKNIGNWDVSSVTSMAQMFMSSNSFNQNLNNWDVSSVTNMSALFFLNETFNSDISSWDVAQVTDMSYMFGGTTTFNQNIGNWDVSNVTEADWMFTSATSFDQDLGSWNVTNIGSFVNMFDNSYLSTENYDRLLIGWSQLDLIPNRLFVSENLKYCLGTEARNEIIDQFNWLFNDAGQECNDTLTLDLKVYLEGAYDPSTFEMTDNLRTDSTFPLNEPYLTFGENHFLGGAETINQDILSIDDNNAIVDWIFIEIKDNSIPSTVLVTQSALIQKDGDIVSALDGTSALSLVNPLSLYPFIHISLKHRSHLDIRTLNTIELTSFTDTIILNFSDPSLEIYGGTNEMNTVTFDDSDSANDIRVMISGDANSDGTINVIDKNIHWQLENGVPFSYFNSNSDFNMDGAVNSFDRNIFWRTNNGKSEKGD